MNCYASALYVILVLATWYIMLELAYYSPFDYRLTMFIYAVLFMYTPLAFGNLFMLLKLKNEEA